MLLPPTITYVSSPNNIDDCVYAGIGEEAVNAIVAAYPTPISLYRAYELTIKDSIAANRNATAAAKSMLANLTQSSGQRVGPSKAAVVYDKLFANGWNTTAV